MGGDGNAVAENVETFTMSNFVRMKGGLVKPNNN
jgi:hypothetical protein